MHRFILVWLCAAFLSACVYRGNFSEKAVDYNKDLERSISVTALMNVVRASERLPMIYSRMGSMNYQGSITAEPKATFAFGGDADTENFEFGFSTGEEGTVPFNAQTDQEFYNAVFQSISGERVKYYRDRGYTDTILFSLFIERIEVKDTETIPTDRASGKPARCADKSYTPPAEDFGLIDAIVGRKDCSTAIQRTQETDGSKRTYLLVFENDPEDHARFKTFMKIIKNVITNYDVSLQSEHPTSLPNPYCLSMDGKTCEVADGAVSSKLKCYAEQEDKKLKLVDQSICRILSGHYKASSIDDKSGIPDSVLPEKNVLFEDSIYAPYPAKTSLVFSRRNGPTGDGKKEKDPVPCAVSSDGTAPGDCNVRIVLRSPDAMLYYLGQLQRAQKDASNRFYLKCGGDLGVCKFKRSPDESKRCTVTVRSNCYEPMFYIQQGNLLQRLAPADALYAFDLHQKSYWIPNNINNRGHTMEYINLINEVISLSQERSDPPSVTRLSGARIR